MADVIECIRIQDSAEAWAQELRRALSAQEESINSRIYTRPLIRFKKCYIEELPDEILARIFLEVVRESSRHILSTVKTSRHFHDIAIPLLYSRLELLPGRSREDMRSLGLSFRRHPERRGYAREAKLRGSPDNFRSLGQFPVLFSHDAFPNIKRLHGIRVAVASLQNLLPADEVSTGTSTIEELIFEESEITICPTGLDALMSACTVVRKLVLHWGRGAAESPSDGEYLQGAMGLAIARNAATLETLEFKPNESQIDTIRENEPGGLKDQLASFSVLKDLTIHLACFYGGRLASSSVHSELAAKQGFYDLLPPCLERLALVGEPEPLTSNDSPDTFLKHASLRAQFGILLHKCGPAGRFSRLKEIQFPEWVNDSDKGRDADVLPQLKSLASYVNVSILFKGKFPPCPIPIGVSRDTD
jgi:hypothetical protein